MSTTSEVLELEQRSLTLTDQARALKIVNQGTYDAAARLLCGASDLISEITAHHRDMKQKAHAAWRSICDAEKRLLAIPEEAKRIAKAAIVSWDQEQARLRREEETRREAEERRLAEEAQLAVALAAEAQGAPAQEVRAILEEQPLVPAVFVPPTYQKASAISRPREYWSGVCDSLPPLIKAAAENPQWQSLLMVNGPALNQLANALRDNLRVPGCRAVCRQDVSVRR